MFRLSKPSRRSAISVSQPAREVLLLGYFSAVTLFSIDVTNIYTYTHTDLYISTVYLQVLYMHVNMYLLHRNVHVLYFAL